jgi:hypothetical protein
MSVRKSPITALVLPASRPSCIIADPTCHVIARRSPRIPAAVAKPAVFPVRSLDLDGDSRHRCPHVHRNTLFDELADKAGAGYVNGCNNV